MSIQTIETYFTREDNKRVVRIIGINYSKYDWEEVDVSSVQLNANQCKYLLGIIKEFDDLFDGTLGKWEISTVYIKLNTRPKTFIARYYLIPRINKDNFTQGTPATSRDRGTQYYQ